MPNYYDSWRTDEYDCPACKWHGVGSALSEGDFTDDYSELLCPACGKYMTVVGHPTVKEIRANWDKLSEDERERVGVMVSLRPGFADRQLSKASQLPDIESPSFVLHWDIDHTGVGSDTLIKHDGTVIFREPALYEGHGRFIEVAEILRARYGTALRDLVPTPASETWLYGDRSSSPNAVAEAR